MKNKKIITVIIVWLGLIPSIYSQVKAGIVLYEVKGKTENSTAEENVQFRAMKKQFIKDAESLVFELSFIDSIALFQLQKGLESDAENFQMEMTKFILRGVNKYYYNSSAKHLIEQQESFGKTVYIKTAFDELEWQITSQTKTISNYICYKALSTKKGKDKNYETTYTPIEAWFCPKLNVPFGPYEAMGLPGLVLEYSLGNFSWVVSKIDFSGKEMEIDFPKSKKFSTREDIDLEIKKKVSPFINKN